MTACSEHMPHNYAKRILSDIETAINEKNYGRMYNIGGDIIKLAQNDNDWLKAIVIISGYLVKSESHVWDAIDLTKRGALLAPENSPIQKQIISSMVVCIKTLPTPLERAEAAQSVAAVAPPNSVVCEVSIDLILENVNDLEVVEDRRRFLKIVMHYAPQGSTAQQRATELMGYIANNIAKVMQADSKSSALIGDFLSKYNSDIAGLFENVEDFKSTMSKKEK